MSLNVYYDDGRIDPHYVQLYFDEYAKCDVTTSAEFFATMSNLSPTLNSFRTMSSGRTRIYDGWARPQGLVDLVRVALEKSVTSNALLRRLSE